MTANGRHESACWRPCCREASTTGEATLPNGTVLELGASDWFAVVKMLYSQIDGPPTQRQEITGKDGGPIITKSIYSGVTG